MNTDESLVAPKATNTELPDVLICGAQAVADAFTSSSPEM